MAGWRFGLGISMLVLSIAAPALGVPLAGMSGLSAGTLASVSAALLVSGEVLGIAAIAVMGRDGFDRIKRGVAAFFRRHGPPTRVSRTRYRIGLVMLCVPVVFGWGLPYLMHLVPGLADHSLGYAIAGDVLLLASLFVLGGEFWEKVRALFIHGATVGPPRE